MSIVKSISVKNGDMYYIKHGSDNFTIIDCNIVAERENEIINEIKNESKDKGIVRFISTHPDEDHIFGLDKFDNKMKFVNFYCVKNEVIKDDETEAFLIYCELRDSEKAYYVYKGCSRKWMNDSDDERKSAGINICWPILTNKFYIEELEKTKNGESPNNICPIISYSYGDMKFVWMGDLETSFLESIMSHIDLSNITILFAPHHGRKSGQVPSELLQKLNPKIIIIGEAPSADIHYYSNYNTITQNTAGDIIFDCDDNAIDIYVSNYDYSVSFLKNKNKANYQYYIGTLV